MYFLYRISSVIRLWPHADLDMAGAVVGFLPTFVIFLLGQRYSSRALL